MWYTILNFCDDFPFFLGCLGVIINMSRQNVQQLFVLWGISRAIF